MEEQKRWPCRRRSQRPPRIHPDLLKRAFLLFVALNLVILPILGARTSPGKAQAATPSPGTTASPGTTTPTLDFMAPVQVATPRPDGSIIHVVEAGQALWSIAATYKVNLDDLLALNGLTSNPVIYPGDRLLIKPADKSPTTPESETALTPASPTATPRPTRTPTPTATELLATATQEADLATPIPPAQESSEVQPSSGGADPLLVVIAVLVFAGTTLVIVGSVLKRAV